MSQLLIRPSTPPGEHGTIVDVTPASADWGYVGFEAVALAGGASITRDAAGRELCIVLLSGYVDITSPHGEWLGVGGRMSPFDGPPEAAYLPPHTQVTITGARGGAEVGLCWAPAAVGTQARLLPASERPTESRGYDVHERFVNNILMAEGEAESLLVCEVLTPSGHWSSYPPHKHDRDALPEESFLEETYYHRTSPPSGFGIQRVYTDDRSLDETMAVHDRDCVLVPRGYHAVAAPPGVAVYYLNVMAGPSRSWAFVDDPDLAWTRADGATTNLPIPKETAPR